MAAPAAPPGQTAAETGKVSYGVPADKMWAVLSSWEGIWLTPDNSPAAVKDVSGAGVGATRKVYMLDESGEWGEEVTKFDAEGMTWSYKITSPLPPPFSEIQPESFVCTMTVCSTGEGSCTAEISASPAPPGLVPILNGMYTAWTASMADKVSPNAAKIARLEEQVAHLKEENQELQDLCIATQAQLCEDAVVQAKRDAELAELTQLCIDTQANLNKSLDTPEARKDEELAELRQLCIETQAKLCAEAPIQERKDQELKELQELCVATQKQLNEDALRNTARDQELEELKQLCIETQANLNKSLDTPEAKKDEELQELRQLCIETQARLCEMPDVEELQATIARKDSELAELQQLCIETQRKLCEEVAAEEGVPPAGA